MSIIHGNIDCIWDDTFKHLEYTKQNITEKEVATWRKMGYTHNSFTGVMYGGANTMPDWVHRVADNLSLSQCGFVFYKMQIGDIMPTHVDHFSKYCEVFGVERTKVRRAVVFLEDWQSGHYFDIGGEAVTNYKAGKYVIWDCDEPHFAANIGIADRYTLQITGV